MFHLILKHRKKNFSDPSCCLLVILISFSVWQCIFGAPACRILRPAIPYFSHVVSFRQKYPQNTISLHYTLRSPSDYGIADIPATYGSLSSDPVAAKASVRNVLSSLQEFDPDTLSSENALTFKILDTYLKKCIHRDRLSALSRASGLLHPAFIPSCLFCSRNTAFYDTQDGRNLSGSLKRNASPILILSSGFEQKKSCFRSLCRITRLILFWTPASLLSIWVKGI